MDMTIQYCENKEKHFLKQIEQKNNNINDLTKKERNYLKEIKEVKEEINVQNQDLEEKMSGNI